MGDLIPDFHEFKLDRIDAPFAAEVANAINGWRASSGGMIKRDASGKWVPDTPTDADIKEREEMQAKADAIGKPVFALRTTDAETALVGLIASLTTTPPTIERWRYGYGQ